MEKVVHLKLNGSRGLYLFEVSTNLFVIIHQGIREYTNGEWFELKMCNIIILYTSNTIFER